MERLVGVANNECEARRADSNEVILVVDGLNMLIPGKSGVSRRRLEAPKVTGSRRLRSKEFCALVFTSS